MGIIDLTPFAKIKVSGPDARKYLDYLLAGTIPKPGRTTLAHALTVGGKVYAEFTVTGLDDGFMVVTGSGSELHDLRHMEEVARNEIFDVKIDNITDDLGVLSIAGPKSISVLTDVLQDSELVEKWKFLDAKQIKINGIDCLAVRISYTGELGWEIYMPRHEMKPVYETIMDKGIKFLNL